MCGRELSKASSSYKETSRPATSRTVGHSQVYLLLIVVLGFLLIFSYQSEIYTVLAGRDGNGSVAGNVTKHLKKPELKVPHADVKVETQTPRSKTEKEVLALGSEDVVHSAMIQRKLESNDSLPKPINISESTGQGTAPPAPPVKNKWDKRDRDRKNEAYTPLVDSVQSNILSSRFQFVVKVLSLNDYGSLVRCLNSLSEAEYAGDSVDIHIYIDHFEISEAAASQRRLLAEGTGVQSTEDGLGEVKSSEKRNELITRAEQIQRKEAKRKTKKSSSRKIDGDSTVLSDEAQVPDRVESNVNAVKRGEWGLIEQKLKDARRVLTYAESFKWKHGKKMIHYRTKMAGSQSQWLDAWWPSSDDEFALFVEDDAELSPLYYRYVRSLIATYYYQPDHYDPSVYGISLQRPQIVPGKNGQPLKVDDRTRLFKYQMIGIWGQIFFPKPWKEFRLWYDSKKSHDVEPIVDGMVTSDWYKEFGERMFSPWFVKFVYNQGYFNLYTNFLKDRVLSVTHRARGVKTKKYAGCDSMLIWSNGTNDIDMWHMAANWNIKRYDYCFKEVRGGRFASYSQDISWVLDSTQENNNILMVSTLGVPDDLVRNCLCNLRKLHIQNYVLLGEDPVLLEDFARRGHATMRFENKAKLEGYVEMEISAVSDVLGLGYDVLFTRADTLWVGNPLTVLDTVEADFIGGENSQLNLFFIRRTEETTLLWGSLKQELSKVHVNVSRSSNWEKAWEKFLKICKENVKIKIGTLQQVLFTDGEKLNEPPTLESGGSSADAQVLVFSGLRSSEKHEIRKELSRLNLWNLNDDLVCAELIC